MKKFFCVMTVVVWLVIGSVTVFADPHAVPGGEKVTTVENHLSCNLSSN